MLVVQNYRIKGHTANIWTVSLTSVSILMNIDHLFQEVNVLSLQQVQEVVLVLVGTTSRQLEGQHAQVNVELDGMRDVEATAEILSLFDIVLDATLGRLL